MATPRAETETTFDDTVELLAEPVEMSTDRFTVRAVVLLLGAIALAGMISMGVLIALLARDAVNRDVASIAALVAIIGSPTGVALGALSTLLARTSTSA